MQSFQKNNSLFFETQGLVAKNKEDSVMQQTEDEPGWKQALLIHYKGQLLHPLYVTYLITLIQFVV